MKMKILNKTILLTLLAVLMVGCSSSQTPTEPPAAASTEAAREDEQYMSQKAMVPAPAPKPPRITFTRVRADEIMSQLHVAHMALAVPASSDINQTIIVQLVIDHEPVKLKDNVAVQSPVLVSKVVTASLSAPEFDIELITPEQQAISFEESTMWVWELRPKSSGTHSIKVSISARVTVDDEKVERFIKTFEHDVDITITTQQVVTRWVKHNWEWVFASILVPIGGWLMSHYKKRRR